MPTVECEIYALNIRSGPGTNFPVISHLIKGQRAVVYGFAVDSWLHTTAPTPGYICSGIGDGERYLVPLDISIPPTTGGMQVQVLADELNVRRVPTTQNNTPLYKIKRGTIVQAESLANGWYKLAGAEAYISADPTLTKIYTGAPAPTPAPTPQPSKPGKVWGINTDPKNPAANPPASALAGCGWVRFVFNVGLETMDQAYARYDPVIRSFAQNGTKVILVLLQDTYWGNGPWDHGNWPGFILGFAAVASAIAQHYRGQVAAYEVWNEMDLAGQPTSIYIPPDVYGSLLVATSKAIKQADPAAKIISGGLAGNDPIGYMVKVRGAIGNLSAVDGIGFHPYGKTPPNTTIFDWPRNTLQPAIQALYSMFKIPVWITEIGVARVDVNNQGLWTTIALYMRNVFLLIHASLFNICPVCIWFAWADSQDSAGIVHDNQAHKGVIYDTFFKNVKGDVANPYEADPPPTTDPTPPAGQPNYPLKTHTVTGVHCEACYDERMPGSSQLVADYVYEMYAEWDRAGKRSWIRVISDAKFANRMANVANVIYRPVKDGAGEFYRNYPFNTEAEAINAANRMYDDLKRDWFDAVDKRCWVQLVNEAEFREFDWAFWRQIIKRFKADGRRGAIFGDATAHRPPEEWVKRIPALRDAYDSGGQIIVVVNAYGYMERLPDDSLRVTDHLVSIPEEFVFFGGWYRSRYAAAPPNARPYLVVAESQSSDSIFRGAERLLLDAEHCAEYDRQDPWFLCRLWYTTGRSWDHDDWEITPALPALRDHVLAGK